MKLTDKDRPLCEYYEFSRQDKKCQPQCSDCKAFEQKWDREEEKKRKPKP